MRVQAVREKHRQQAAKKDEIIQSQLKHNADTFDVRLNEKETAAANKQKSIEKLEQIENDMLNRIKNTQSLQLKVFGDLESAMYQQQFGVSKRVAQN